jgi:antitoxin YefM
MKVVSYTAARNNLAKLLDQVNDDQAPILVTRQNGRPAVIVSVDEWESHAETRHLLRSPRNAQRLAQSMKDAEAGRLKAHKLQRR